MVLALVLFDFSLWLLLLILLLLGGVVCAQIGGVIVLAAVIRSLGGVLRGIAQIFVLVVDGEPVRTPDDVEARHLQDLRLLELAPPLRLLLEDLEFELLVEGVRPNEDREEDEGEENQEQQRREVEEPDDQPAAP